MALHDALTGLPNRTLLQDRLVQAIAQCVRLSKKLALAFIDLDHFKPINDAHGHQMGDQILVEVARCVSAAVRKTDTVARWGDGVSAYVPMALRPGRPSSFRWSPEAMPPGSALRKPLGRS